LTGASNGTEDSIRAARAAVALSTGTGAELHVVHVGQAAARPPLPGEPPRATPSGRRGGCSTAR
jgi:nucleotide-binding universal stress UspA family protein